MLEESVLVRKFSGENCYKLQMSGKHSRLDVIWSWPWSCELCVDLQGDNLKQFFDRGLPFGMKERGFDLSHLPHNPYA